MKSEMTLLEAKERFFPEYQYAVVDFCSNKPLFICKTIEDARKKTEFINKFYSRRVFMIELREV